MNGEVLDNFGFSSRNRIEKHNPNLEVKANLTEVTCMLEWSLSVIYVREGFNQADERLHLKPYRAKSLRTEF